MKGNKIITGLAAGGILVFLFSLLKKGQGLNSITSKVTSVRINGLNLFVDLQIFNPSNESITIDSISANVFFNDTSVGVIEFLNKTPIQPFSYTDLKNIKISLSPIGIIILTTRIIRRQERAGTFLIDGKIFVAGIGLPLNEIYKLW